MLATIGNETFLTVSKTYCSSFKEVAFSVLRIPQSVKFVQSSLLLPAFTDSFLCAEIYLTLWRDSAII